MWDPVCAMWHEFSHRDLKLYQCPLLYQQMSFSQPAISSPGLDGDLHNPIM